jgi:hypothetical protein
MPVFDRSASKTGRVERDFLRSVLGPAKPGPTPFQQASRKNGRRLQRATVTRALIVLVLLGSFCGSAFVMSQTRHRPHRAAPVLLSAAPQAVLPARAIETASTSGGTVGALP